MRKIKTIIILLLVSITGHINAQYLHADGKKIVDGEGNNFIIRSMGLGGWMLQEGYLLGTAGIYGTQWEFKEKLESTIGKDKTQEFYDKWLNSGVTKRDIDSLKSWGFNSVRLAMHYNLFTLPIEDESGAGENTWLPKGFEMIDDLLSWCEANEMYLILDMHAAPGGQGKNADISDYDESKPSLWESSQNRNKTVALWKKLAERYADEKWIGGYDLLNETNWPLPNENKMLLDLYKDITAAIREVDNKHIIYIEGNGFANDFTGLTPPWDNNLVYSFHKYWTYNKANDLDWILWLREEHNVPLWLGESGENSNTWFTDLIELCENNNIGWSWWPLKKSGINNPLTVINNDDYDQLVKSWRGEISRTFTAEETFSAVMTFADRQKIENCKINYDVIDAMFRQVYSDESLPFGKNVVGENIYFSDYDLGANNVAYSDTDIANYHGNTGDFTTWNKGWTYRNDGVDIETCVDAESNGYSVGWVENSEWLVYTIELEESKIYDLVIRSASNTSEPAIIQLELDGVDLSHKLNLENTSGWDKWKSKTFTNIPLFKGKHKLKVKFERGGSNLNYFKFTNPRSVASVETVIDNAFTSVDGSSVYLALNKIIDSSPNLNLDDFTIYVDGTSYEISSVSYEASNQRLIRLDLSSAIKLREDVKLSVKQDVVKSEDGLMLGQVADKTVSNLVVRVHELPGMIEAEDFNFNHGLSLEECSDIGSGKNIAYTDNGDFLDYKVKVNESGFYEVQIRNASDNNGGKIVFQIVSNDGLVENVQEVSLSSTNGWQNWVTNTSSIKLDSGEYTLRVYIGESGFNLNWINFIYKSNVFHQVPGTVEAEYFSKNSGFNFESCSDTNGGYNLSYADKNDYVEYNLEVNSEAVYDLIFRVASNSDYAGGMRIDLVDGSTLHYLSEVLFSKTGGWQSWKDFTTSVKLPVGDIKIRLTVFDKEFNLNNIKFVEKAKSVFSIPGTIKLSDFYYNNGFKTESCYDNDGGLNLTDANIGDYVEFPVLVDQGGDYNITLRAASPYFEAGSVEIELLNQNSEKVNSTTLEFDRTGSWQQWNDFNTQITIDKGEFTLRIRVVASGFNLNWIKLEMETGMSLENFDKIGCNIYPNPCIDSVNIYSEFNQKNARLDIIDTKASVVYSNDVKLNKHNSINISRLKSGMYIVRLWVDQQTFTHKIFKQ